MGHLKRSELVTSYNRMKRDAAGRSCSILILVAPTVDALCALKILTVAHSSSALVIDNGLGAAQV